jgi:Xylanase inhibitor N-terminal
MASSSDTNSRAKPALRQRSARIAPAVVAAAVYFFGAHSSASEIHVTENQNEIDPFLALSPPLNNDLNETSDAMIDRIGAAWRSRTRHRRRLRSADEVVPPSVMDAIQRKLAEISSLGLQPSSSNSTTPVTTPSSTGTIIKVPLHEKSGTHHLVMYVGEPPQARTLIVDTGSRLTAWLCDGCDNCGSRSKHAHSNYKLHKSSTAIVHTCDNPAQPSFKCEWMDVSECKRPEHNLLMPVGKKTKALSANSTAIADSKQCIIRQRYTEGSSWTATETNDLVALETIDGTIDDDVLRTTVAMTFGCQTHVHELFRNQYADGILGMEWTNKSIVHALYTQGVISSRSFAMCLTTTAGVISFGGPNIERHLSTIQSKKKASGAAKNVTSVERLLQQHEHHFEGEAVPDASTGGMVYTPARQRFPAMFGEENKLKNLPRNETQHLGGWYAVDIVEVWFNNEVLVIPPNSSLVQSFNDGRGTILDSGTTDTYIPYAVHDAFGTAWQAMTGVPYSEPKHFYTYEDFLKLPTIHFVLAGNVTISVEPYQYMELLPEERHPWEKKKELTLRIYVSYPS